MHIRKTQTVTSLISSSTHIWLISSTKIIDSLLSRRLAMNCFVIYGLAVCLSRVLTNIHFKECALSHIIVLLATGNVCYVTKMYFFKVLVNRYHLYYLKMILLLCKGYNLILNEIN